MVFEDVDEAMPELRAAAEALMVDVCRVIREVRGETLDPATLEYPLVTTTVYQGRCEFKAANTAVQRVDAQGQALATQGAVLKIPVDAPGSAAVAEGDFAIVTLRTFDATSAPIRARVSGQHAQTRAVSRRLPIEVTT